MREGLAFDHTQRRWDKEVGMSGAYRAEHEQFGFEQIGEQRHQLTEAAATSVSDASRCNVTGGGCLAHDLRRERLVDEAGTLAVVQADARFRFGRLHDAGAGQEALDAAAVESLLLVFAAISYDFQ